MLDVFGLDGSGGTAREFQGTSLLGYLDDRGRTRTPDSREVLTRTVWERPIYALRNSSHTFIYNVATADFSLFDRSKTPRLEGKDHDYAPRAPIALREMYRQNLLAWVARSEEGSRGGGHRDRYRSRGLRADEGPRLPISVLSLPDEVADPRGS